MNEALRKAVEDVARKAFAFDAMVAAGRISEELAAESLALADGPIELTAATTIRQALRDQESEIATRRANHDVLVIRFGEVTARLEAADGLLREWLVGKWCTPEYDAARQRAYDHLKAADHV